MHHLTPFHPAADIAIAILQPDPQVPALTLHRNKPEHVVVLRPIGDKPNAAEITCADNTRTLTLSIDDANDAAEPARAFIDFVRDIMPDEKLLIQSVDRGNVCVALAIGASLARFAIFDDEAIRDAARLAIRLDPQFGPNVELAYFIDRALDAEGRFSGLAEALVRHAEEQPERTREEAISGRVDFTPAGCLAF